MEELEAAGHPVISIDLPAAIDLGGEFVRWEVATAIAGVVLGIDPFDQPNVEEAKENTRRLLAGTTPAAERGNNADGVRGVSGAGRPRADAMPVLAQQDPITLIGDTALRLTHGDGTGRRAARHLARLQAGLCRPPGVHRGDARRDAALARIRLLRGTRRATRQRPGTGRATSTPPGSSTRAARRRAGSSSSRPTIRRTAPIPGWPYTFGELIDAQARGRLRRRSRRTTCRSCACTWARTATAAWPTLERRSTQRCAGRATAVEGGTPMKIGFIGLGRMGANMVRRVLRDGHEVVAYNRTPEKTREIAGEGAEAAFTLEELVSKLEKPRAVWIMVPAGDATEAQIEDLMALLEPGDTIVDGGNTNFHDDQRRYPLLKAKGIHYVDAGVSGGIWGLANGFCLMVGGDPEPVQRLEPIFTSLAPEDGYLHVAARAPATT